ncbi:Hypothetical_protein [Hexamita inflata]|uniref:Hypothetical_protein n=1 Tax=Hexamita inflata TaxID=28002 RepID=A0AA86QPL4_9EUKA|nr:Hypothetical protein HINF_LOCUS48267 [Hexamita inflata]
MIPSSRELGQIAGVVDHVLINNNSTHQNTQQKREELFSFQNVAQESTIRNQTEILKQQLYDLQSQILEANKRFQSEQGKLKLAHENIKLLTLQAEMKQIQKTTDQNTLQSLKHNCAKEQLVMLDQSCFSYHSLNLSQENQNKLLEKQIQQMQKQLELTNKKVINEQLKLRLANETIANLKAEVQKQVSSSESQYNPANKDFILKDKSETKNANPPVYQNINKQQNNKMILNQQSLLLRLALKQTLKEAGYEVETLSEKEICNTVHQLTLKEKRQLRFWDRIAQLCCRSKQQIVHFYRQTYKSRVYKNKPSQRVYVDNSEQQVCQQSDIQKAQIVSKTQKDGQVIIRKKGTQSGSQLISFALSRNRLSSRNCI